MVRIKQVTFSLSTSARIPVVAGIYSQTIGLTLNNRPTYTTECDSILGHCDIAGDISGILAGPPAPPPAPTGAKNLLYLMVDDLRTTLGADLWGVRAVPSVLYYRCVYLLYLMVHDLRTTQGTGTLGPPSHPTWTSSRRRAPRLPTPTVTTRYARLVATHS